MVGTGSGLSVFTRTVEGPDEVADRPRSLHETRSVDE